MLEFSVTIVDSKAMLIKMIKMARYKSLIRLLMPIKKAISILKSVRGARNRSVKVISHKTPPKNLWKKKNSLNLNTLLMSNQPN
jgi:hypothetical protein